MITAFAVAHSNIALAKYWGKSDEGRNLPAVPSVSMTLAALKTETEVRFDPSLKDDVVLLDGKLTDGSERNRVVDVLNRIRLAGQVSSPAFVSSKNSFPTAAGLASSASGFAALALAASFAAGMRSTLDEISARARQASASAARSLYGGFVKLEANAECAEPVAPATHFPLSMVIALTARGPKAIGSTQGMRLTRDTSPYYDAWVKEAPAIFRRTMAAIADKDLEALGTEMEQSALMMHASMFAANPGLVYFEPATIAVMQAVRRMRGAGIQAYYTMDAGPHVKIVTAPQDAEAVAMLIRGTSGVSEVIVTGIGPDASVSVSAEES